MNWDTQARMKEDIAFLMEANGMDYWEALETVGNYHYAEYEEDEAQGKNPYGNG